MKLYNNVVNIPTSIDGKFFRFWVESLRLFHHLTEGEMAVFAVLLKKRYELSKVITDQKLLDEILFSEKTRREIRNTCNISLQHFQVVLGKLKKANVIINGGINPKMIPHIEEEKGSFKLLFNFDLK